MQSLASSAASFSCKLHSWHGFCHDQAVNQQLLLKPEYCVNGRLQAHADARVNCDIAAGLAPFWLWAAACLCNQGGAGHL